MLKKGEVVQVPPSARHFSTPHAEGAEVDTGKTWHLQRRTPRLRMEEFWRAFPMENAGLIVIYSGLIVIYSGLIVIYSGLIVIYSGLIVIYSGLIVIYSGLIVIYSGLIVIYSGLIVIYSGLIVI